MTGLFFLVANAPSPPVGPVPLRDIIGGDLSRWFEILRQFTLVLLMSKLLEASGVRLDNLRLDEELP